MKRTAGALKDAEYDSGDSDAPDAGAGAGAGAGADGKKVKKAKRKVMTAEQRWGWFKDTYGWMDRSDDARKAWFTDLTLRCVPCSSVLQLGTNLSNAASHSKNSSHADKVAAHSTQPQLAFKPAPRADDKGMRKLRAVFVINAARSVPKSTIHLVVSGNSGRLLAKLHKERMEPASATTTARDMTAGVELLDAVIAEKLKGQYYSINCDEATFKSAFGFRGTGLMLESAALPAPVFVGLFNDLSPKALKVEVVEEEEEEEAEGGGGGGVTEELKIKVNSWVVDEMVQEAAR